MGKCVYDVYIHHVNACTDIYIKYNNFTLRFVTLGQVAVGTGGAKCTRMEGARGSSFSLRTFF